MSDEELIEKVALAIHDAHVPVEGTEVPPWDLETDAWRETYRDFARAALAVFREHTAPGRAIVRVSMNDDDTVDEVVARDAWASINSVAVESTDRQDGSRE